MTKRHFGETCQDQNECLMSQDPHLDCLEVRIFQTLSMEIIPSLKPHYPN